MLGLSAGELGRLLMRHWGLPAGLVEDVCDIDRIVVTPANPVHTRRGARLALCCLCARVGEVVARDPLRDLASCDPFVTMDPEFHYFRSHFGAADRARLEQARRSPDLSQAILRITNSHRVSTPLPTSDLENRMFVAEMDDERR